MREKLQWTRSGEYGSYRTFRMLALPKSATQPMATDVNSVVCRGDHILYAFFPSAAINKGSEQERYNLACMRHRVQGQSVLSGFTLRILAPSP